MTSLTFFFISVPILVLLLLVINLLLFLHNSKKENSAFEWQYHSFLGQNRMQFSISFFIFALLFLLFDLEILLVYPSAISSYANGLYGLIIMLAFFFVLTLGFIFELGKNSLYKIRSNSYSLLNKVYLVFFNKNFWYRMILIILIGLLLKYFIYTYFGVIITHYSYNKITIGYFIFMSLLSAWFFKIFSIYDTKNTSIIFLAIKIFLLGLIFRFIINNFECVEITGILWKQYDFVFSFIILIIISWFEKLYIFATLDGDISVPSIKIDRKLVCLMSDNNNTNTSGPRDFYNRPLIRLPTPQNTIPQKQPTIHSERSMRTPIRIHPLGPVLPNSYNYSGAFPGGRYTVLDTSGVAFRGFNPRISTGYQPYANNLAAVLEDIRRYNYDRIYNKNDEPKIVIQDLRHLLPSRDYEFATKFYTHKFGESRLFNFRDAAQALRNLPNN